MIFSKEEFVDTKRVIRCSESKDRQSNGQTKKDKQALGILFQTYHLNYLQYKHYDIYCVKIIFVSVEGTTIYSMKMNGLYYTAIQPKNDSISIKKSFQKIGIM